MKCAMVVAAAVIVSMASVGMAGAYETTALNAGGAGFQGVGTMLAVGDQLYFVGSTYSQPAPGAFQQDDQIWVTGGSAAGAAQVTNVSLGTRFFGPTQVQTGTFATELASRDGQVVFVSDPGTAGRGLYAVNGSGADVLMAPVRNGPHGLVSAGPVAYFHVGAADYLYATGGTAGTTGAVFLSPLAVQSVTPIGSNVYFSGYTDAAGSEPYVMAVGSNAPVSLGDLAGGAGSSGPSSFTRQGGSVYFVAGASGVGQVYRTNGTAAGTQLAAASAPYAAANGVFGAASGVVIDGRDASFNSEPYGISGGSAVQLATVNGMERETTTADGRVYWISRGAGSALQVWSSDGTVAGTAMADQVAVGADPLDSNTLIFQNAAWGDRYVFGTIHGGARQLWVYDPASDATSLLLATDPAQYAEVESLAVAGDALYYVVSGETGDTLYRATVPEPGVVGLVGVAMMGMVARRRRQGVCRGGM